jgi:hypothetical protein
MKTSIQKLIIALVWLALPLLAQAQFTFTTNSGAITITGYTGSGGAVVIPAATNGYPVTTIGDDAFSYYDLTSVTIPNSVTNIGNYAFAYNYLTNVTIPNSVTSIGDYAFARCFYLTNVTIGNGVTYIGNEEFVSDPLTSVTIPNSVTSIGDSAFALTALTSVTITNSVTYIGVSAFENCQSLTNVNIGTNVTYIDDQAFSGSALTSVTIPNSVIYIGVGSFSFCTNMTSATIGNRIIGVESFSSCSSLKSVTILNGVTSIGGDAFSSTLLTTVIIPKSVNDIGNYAFDLCPKLTAAYFLGNMPSGNVPFPVGYAFDYPISVVYYLSGTTGWGSTFSDVPAVLWNPQAITPGFTGGQFGFNLTGPTNAVIVVEATINLSNPVWLPVATNTLSASGTSAFTDPSSQPSRFYRFRSP